jgi:hypothetical protein
MLVALQVAAASLLGAQQPMKVPPGVAYISTRWFNVWDPAGRPVTLVCYSVPVPALIWRGPATDRHADMRLRFQYTAADGVLHDSTWSWQPTPSMVSPLSPIVTGILVLRVNGPVRSWGLTATDDTSATGLPAANHVELSAANPELALSDLVVGDSAGGARWSNGSENVFVTGAPFHDRHRPLSLYYQLRAGARHERLATTVTITDTRPGKNARQLRLVSRANVDIGVNSFSRTVDLSRLRPGRYLLRIEVAEDRAGAALHSEVVVDLQ